jgi:hypothetical protein
MLIGAAAEGHRYTLPVYQRFKMRWLFIILLLASCSSRAERVNSQAPTAPPPFASLPAPEGWVLYPSPPADSPALRCANYSMREWKVTLAGENLQIRLDTRRDHQDPLPSEISSENVAVGSKGDRHVIRVEDGWLVGLDVGEFGGALWWFSSNGRNSKKLANENVVGFAKSSKGVLALVGLAHMGLDSGKVLRITDGEAGNRKVEALADLGAAPRTFAVESPDSLLIVTTRGLVRVRTSGMADQLLSTNYGLLYPNSMTLFPSGVIHVGLRHFITRLMPTGNSYSEEWFVPVGCSRFRIRDYDCVCVSGRK